MCDKNVYGENSMVPEAQTSWIQFTQWVLEFVWKFGMLCVFGKVNVPSKAKQEGSEMYAW